MLAADDDEEEEDNDREDDNHNNNEEGVVLHDEEDGTAGRRSRTMRARQPGMTMTGRRTTTRGWGGSAGAGTAMRMTGMGEQQ